MQTYQVNSIAPATVARAHEPRTWQGVAALLSLPAAAGCVLIGALAACVAIWGMVVIFTQVQVNQTEPVLDQFMTAMAARDTGRAYTYLSPSARQQVSRADLEGMLTGENFALFEGYERIDNLDGFIDSDSEIAGEDSQGWVVLVTGEVYYDDGCVGSFEATLSWEDGTYLLYGIEVTVPPEKLVDSRYKAGDRGAGDQAAQ